MALALRTVRVNIPRRNDWPGLCHGDRVSSDLGDWRGGPGPGLSAGTGPPADSSRTAAPLGWESNGESRDHPVGRLTSQSARRFWPGRHFLCLFSHGRGPLLEAGLLLELFGAVPALHVAPLSQLARDPRPALLAIECDELDEAFVLVGWPVVRADPGVEPATPALAALRLRAAIPDKCRNHRPRIESGAMDAREQPLVFVGRPGRVFARESWRFGPIAHEGGGPFGRGIALSRSIGLEDPMIGTRTETHS
jgi:hypothetical protein